MTMLNLTSIFLFVLLIIYDNFCDLSKASHQGMSSAIEDVLDNMTTLNCTWNLCNIDDPKHPCKCDRHCISRRDCCQDFWKTINAEDALEVSHQLPHLQATTCETVTTAWKLKRQSASFIMVSVCPENLPEEHLYAKSMCESLKLNNNPYNQIPVQSHATNVTYKNIFCAMCHDDVLGTSFWNSSIGCYPNAASDIWEAMNLYNKKCSLQVQPPPGAVPCKGRSFEKQVTSRCNVNASEIVQLMCATTNAKVKVHDSKYQSIYCAMCNVGPNVLQQDVQCIDINREHHHCINCLPSGIPLPNKSFALLFDANFQSKGNILGMQTLCPSGYQFSPHLKQCQEIFCSETFYLVDGKCMRDTTDPLTDSNTTKTKIPGMTNASMTWLHCPKISMDIPTNQTFIDQNGSLLLLDTREVFSNGMYEFSNATLVVCANTSQNYVSKFPGMTFKYVSIVGCVVSLVALTLKMITFLMMPEARSLPDRIVFCLSACLFLVQLLFMSAATSVLIYSLCASIAVLMHYCFLATFFWMNVLAFDVWSTFANTESPFKDKKSQQCKFLKYSLYAWLVPFCIVSVGSIFDWTLLHLPEFSPLRPYYGQVLCWISSRPALLLYFLAPVGVLLATNLVLFSLTTLNICSRSRKTLVAQKAMHTNFPQMKCKLSTKTRAHHLNVCLYFKLGVILGLTWISGFIAAYADQPAFWYFFTVINSLQGVYILLAFTPYKKLRQCVHRFMGKTTYMSSRNGHHTHSQRSSTRSSLLTRSISTGSTQRALVLSPSMG